MRYVFENGCSMPLCGYDGEFYYKFENGEIIDNVCVLEFIKKGLSKKTMNIKEVDLIIYKIRDSKGKIRAYNYVINNSVNYLDIFKQPLTSLERAYISKQLMSGEFKQELLWGGNNG